MTGPGAPLAVSFSEPVKFTAGGATLQCTGSGTHTVGISGGAISDSFATGNVRAIYNGAGVYAGGFVGTASTGSGSDHHTGVAGPESARAIAATTIAAYPPNQPA